MTPPAALARRGTGRIAWIDVSRGWCMLAIVAGHFYLPWNQHPHSLKTPGVPDLLVGG